MVIRKPIYVGSITQCGDITGLHSKWRPIPAHNMKMFLHVLMCWWRLPCCHVLGNCRSIVSMLPASWKVFSSCIWHKLRWSWLECFSGSVLFNVWSVGVRYVSSVMDLSVETTCHLILPPARAKWMLLSLHSLNTALPLIMVGYFWCP